MKILLGVGGQLKNCKYRIKWYIKQTFLPPREIGESARKSIEIKARRLTSGDGRKPETPALDIISRALASSSASSSSSCEKSKKRIMKGSADQPAIRPPVQPLSNKPANKPIKPIRLNSGDSDKLEIFNCKNCHENSSGEDLESYLENCKPPKATESVLKQEPSKSAEPLKKRAESPDNATKKAKPKQSGESSITQDKPPAASSQSEKPTNAASKSFPAGRNPCTGGKRGNGQISKGTALKRSSGSEVDMKSVPCPKQEKETENRRNKPKEDPSKAANLPSESARKNPCGDGKKGGEKSESADLKQSSKSPEKEKKTDNSCNKQKIKESEENKKPTKPAQINPKINGSMADSAMKPSQDVNAKPKEQKDKKDDPSKSPPESQTTKEWKKPELPTSEFNFPLLTAFPSGRNPCRDGPRGGSKEEGKVSEAECQAEEKDSKAEEKDCKAEEKESKAESEEECQEPEKKSKEESVLEKCLSWAEMTKKSSSNKKVSESHKNPQTKATKISNSEKGKTQTPTKETKAPSDHPKGSIGSKPPESVPTKTVKEAVKSSEKIKADIQEASASVVSQEKSKQAEASKKLITDAEKAVSSQEKSMQLEASKKLKTEAEKAVSSQEKSMQLEASKKLKTEAEKAVSSQEKSMQLEASKKLKTEAEKAVSSQDISKQASQKVTSEAQKVVSSQEKLKQGEDPGKLKTQDQKAVSTQEKSKNLETSKKFKTEAQKAISSQEKSKNLEASTKITSEARKAASSQEKSKTLEASKKCKTDAGKAALSQEKSKNLDTSKQCKAEAQKAISSQEKSKNLEASKEVSSEAQKAVSTQEKSENLDTSTKCKAEAQKAISSQEKSKNLEASTKITSEAQKAASSQEKSKNLEASKKCKTDEEKAASSQKKSKKLETFKKCKIEAQKAASSQEKSKNLEASKIVKSEAQKASATVSSTDKKIPSTKEDSSKDLIKPPELKQFPVPPLKLTLMAYLESIEPLLTAKEFKKQVKLTEDFEAKEGSQLQELLKAAADNCTNWLTPRWTEATYLAFRAPVTAFTSPALSFPVQKFTKCTDCLIFTARAISAICKFKTLVDHNKIPVAMMGPNQLDNSQFSNIFGTVRKPGRFCDTIEQCCDSDYAVVVYRNNYFQLPLISSSGDVLSVSNIVDELEAIINCRLPRGDPYGLLTHDNRGNWAEVYGAMLCLPGNADTIETIEQSLFVVCLDDYVPVPQGQELTVQAHQLLHGGGIQQNSANRWMDKTIQLIVNPNGLAGFCYEQSPAECQPLAMLMDYVMEKIKSESESKLEQSNNGDSSTPARLLKFHPQNECINMWMHVAMRNIAKIASKLRLNVFEYECHGRDFIKAQGLNSDSYIQMALQLAYFKMHKTLPAQYESAHLRMFVDGRTETIRSTTNQSKAFLLAMSVLHASEMEKLTALQVAVDFHEKLTKRALNGEGIDRHLFGLQQMAIENGLTVPEFFRSKGYIRSVTFQLFTCQVATTNNSFMAYGPLTCDGYGCCYNPKENKIIFAVSAWSTSHSVNPEHLGKAIKKSLDDMRKLIVKTGGERVGEHPCHCEPF